MNGCVEHLSCVECVAQDPLWRSIGKDGHRRTIAVCRLVMSPLADGMKDEFCSGWLMILDLG